MSQAAGWYNDPENPENLRYFDGVLWTQHITPRASPSAAQSTIGLPQSPSQSSVQTQQVPSDAPPREGQPAQQQWQQPPQQWQQPPQQQWQQPPYPPSYPYQGMPPSYSVALGLKTTPDGVPLAGYGQRVGAYLLDLLILGVLSGIAGGYWLYRFGQWYAGLIGDLVDQGTNGSPATFDQTKVAADATGYLWPFVLVSVVLTLAYHVFFLMRSGATPGKMALGITVRRRDRPGPLSFVDALKRQAIPLAAGLLAFVPVVSLVTSLGSLLDLLWPLWDDKRQALHDKLAGTNVVIRPRER